MAVQSLYREEFLIIIYAVKKIKPTQKVALGQVEG